MISKLEVNLGDVNGRGTNDTLVVENFGHCAHGSVQYGEGGRSTFYINLYPNQALGNIVYNKHSNSLGYSIFSKNFPVKVLEMSLTPYFNLRIDSHAHTDTDDAKLTSEERQIKFMKALTEEAADLKAVIADREARITRLESVIGHYSRTKVHHIIEKEEPYFADYPRREADDQTMSVLNTILKGELEKYKARLEQLLTRQKGYL